MGFVHSTLILVSISKHAEFRLEYCDLNFRSPYIWTCVWRWRLLAETHSRRHSIRVKRLSYQLNLRKGWDCQVWGHHLLMLVVASIQVVDWCWHLCFASFDEMRGHLWIVFYTAFFTPDERDTEKSLRKGDMTETQRIDRVIFVSWPPKKSKSFSISSYFLYDTVFESRWQ